MNDLYYFQEQFENEIFVFILSVVVELKIKSESFSSCKHKREMSTKRSLHVDKSLKLQRDMLTVTVKPTLV